MPALVAGMFVLTPLVGRMAPSIAMVGKSFTAAIAIDGFL